MDRHYPSIYQINTRVWLTELTRKLGRPATLDDIPDSELDRLAGMGFDWIWCLSVWTTGLASQKVSRNQEDWKREYKETLPDLQAADIAGSGFAVTGYSVHPALGGDEALARLREKLKKRGLKLMLDFVPNHMGLDHPWLEQHPEYFIPGTEDQLAREPQNYVRVRRKQGDLVLAYGRDPYFSGWPDTLQLDYSKPSTQAAMMAEIERISRQCDGLRCDMAMLVLPDIFERTWGHRAPLFWPEAIQRVKKDNPKFTFMAEVYWDMEWTLQQQGFDYAYDKRLYDRLREGHTRPVREHLMAGLDYQDKLARFLENHDEPRAAATFGLDQHRAAAIITFLSPGLRFFHQGQFEGRKKRISPHLVRAPQEPLDRSLQDFYGKLMTVLKQPAVRDGRWRLLECRPAWEGNGSWDSFLAYAWEGPQGDRSIVVVNYAPHASQGSIQLPFSDLVGRSFRLQDQMSPAGYDWSGNDILARGLFVDLPAWGYNIFDLKTTEKR